MASWRPKEALRLFAALFVVPLACECWFETMVDAVVDVVLVVISLPTTLYRVYAEQCGIARIRRLRQIMWEYESV